jgi:glycosidase
MSKLVIYQLFPRYFSNKQPHPVIDGDLSQNGCGKFEEINEYALRSIKSLGVTHLWLTGVLEHATKTDYSHIGIHKDHPSVVKGKAGSPYAIKDYYDVDPDLAVNPEQRLEEFSRLLRRCHAEGLSVLIDFVPNHLAREYRSDMAAPGIRDFGIDDHTNHGFNPSNNFYYLPDQALELQTDRYAGSDTPYMEFPAKATGNDCFTPFPGQNDWYDTVKLNYGVNHFLGGTVFFDPIPSTWFKMLDVLQYWAALGIDGFRCDMAEMVPVEFWNWVIPRLKKQHPSLLFIAEMYQPNRYRDYLYKGGFDYLYDKVGLYETLRGVIEKRIPASDLSACWQSLNDVLPHMLYFLENHDEQRIASDFFAMDPFRGVPGMLLAACLQSNPVMIYSGQELGEKGMFQEGFSGLDGRNTLFDYWSLPSLIGWNNQGRWDGGGLTAEQAELRRTYAVILNLALNEKAISDGVFFDLTYANLDNSGFDSDTQFTFFRKYDKELLLFIVNFSAATTDTSVHIPAHAFGCLDLPADRAYKATDLLSGKSEEFILSSKHPIGVSLPGNSGVVLKFCLI